MWSCGSFFFFKQKTAYEMRISDWSSDVCASDLQALKILENLDHRGAVGADELMGDGAGILIQIPDQLYREDMAGQGVTLPPPDDYGEIGRASRRERVCQNV